MNRISIFKNFTKVIGHRSLEAIIEAIRKDTYKEQVLKIRTTILKENYKLKDQLKKQLIAFTVSGEFEGGRTMDKLVNYHPFVILDIDNQSETDIKKLVDFTPMLPFTKASFISPGGRGLKIIVEVNSNQAQHKNAYQQVANYYEKELQVPIDQSGKDITRLCFMSWDTKAYYTNEHKLFLVIPKHKERNPTEENINNNALTKLKKAIALCVDYTNQKSEYKNGNRNNYIYLLASNANRFGLKKEQVLAHAYKTFDLEKNEIQQSVASAYKNHVEEYKTNPITKIKKKSIAENFDIHEYLFKAPYFKNNVFTNLPKLLAEAVSVFHDPRERDVFLAGAIGVLSGCVPKVSGIYDRSCQYPNHFLFLIAPAASGKGVLSYAKMLGDALHESLKEWTKEAYKEYLKQEMDYQKAMNKYRRSKLPNPPELPPKPPFKMLFIPANSSSAMVIQHLRDTQGSGIMCETEADTLANVLKQDWGGYSDVLRKCFHFERVSYSRKSNNEFFEIDEPRLTVVLSGTPHQFLHLIPSTEDGLFSRFAFYSFSVEQKWRDVSPPQNPNQVIDLKAHFKKLSEKVLELYSWLNNHPTKVVLTKEQWNLLNNTFSNMLQETNTLVDREANSSIKRLGVILFRIILTLTALRKWENKNEVENITCHPNDFSAAIQIVECYKEHAELLFKKLPKKSAVSFNHLPNNKKAFYKALPKQFKRKEAIEIGQDYQFSRATIDRLLQELTGHFLEQPSYGLYQKRVSEKVE